MAQDGTSAQLREQLRDQGFVLLPALFSDADMDALQRKSEAVLEGTSEEHRERFRSNGSLCNIAELPEYAALLSDSRLLEALRDLGGADIRWTSGYLISKPPGGAPLFWHQDWWGWDSPISYTDSPAQLFVMIYLTDTRIDNGCLRVIPGSHRNAHPLHTLPAAHAKTLATEVDEQSPAYASHPDEIPVTVRRGDVVIGDSRLLHGAYENRSGHERPLLTLWYIPNWRTLPNDVQATLRDIYERKVVDIDDGEEDLPTCDAWPETAFSRIRDLIPRVDGNSPPLPWNRIPDTNRMRSTLEAQCD